MPFRQSLIARPGEHSSASWERTWSTGWTSSWDADHRFAQEMTLARLRLLCYRPFTDFGHFHQNCYFIPSGSISYRSTDFYSFCLCCYFDVRWVSFIFQHFHSQKFVSIVFWKSCLIALVLVRRAILFLKWCLPAPFVHLHSIYPWNCLLLLCFHVGCYRRLLKTLGRRVKSSCCQRYSKSLEDQNRWKWAGSFPNWRIHIQTRLKWAIFPALSRKTTENHSDPTAWL